MMYSYMYFVLLPSAVLTANCSDVMQPTPFVCVHNYCNSDLPISFKPAVMIWSTSRKNRLTFGGNPVPDTDSGSLFHYPIAE